MQIYIRKLDEYVDVDVNALPAESVEYAIEYGLTQSLNDCHAPITRKGANPFKGTDEEFHHEVITRVNDRLDDLNNGKVGKRSKGPAKPKASLASVAKEMAAKGYIPPMGDDEFARLLADFVKSRTETAEAPAEAA